MASIIKRKKNYSIVYTYVDENGETKQKWETRTSYQEALKRKAEIESQKSSNSFLPPTNQNIAEFLSDFVSLYGEKRWGVSMYDSQNSLIANYINPIIGDMKVQDITTSPTLPSKRSSNFSAAPSNRRFGGSWLPRTHLTMWCCPKWNTRSGTSGPPI